MNLKKTMMSEVTRFPICAFADKFDPETRVRLHPYLRDAEAVCTVTVIVEGIEVTVPTCAEHSAYGTNRQMIAKHPPKYVHQRTNEDNVNTLLQDMYRQGYKPILMSYNSYNKGIEYTFEYNPF
jgi:hypothetical protein